MNSLLKLEILIYFATTDIGRRHHNCCSVTLLAELMLLAFKNSV